MRQVWIWHYFGGGWAIRADGPFLLSSIEQQGSLPYGRFPS